jgi:hypothetical protein
MNDTFGLLTARAVRVLDRCLIAWIVLWIVLGAVVAHDVGVQARLSESVVRIGGAVRQTGDALAAVGSIPLVGGSVRDLAAKVQKAGADVRVSGNESVSAIHRTAVVAGLSVALLPAALVLLLYLPLRLAWRRDRQSLSAALAGSDDPAFEQYLARRAIASLPWTRLRVISDDPWDDVAAGRWRELADAELARLDLRRPA